MVQLLVQVQVFSSWIAYQTYLISKILKSEYLYLSEPQIKTLFDEKNYLNNEDA